METEVHNLTDLRKEIVIKYKTDEVNFEKNKIFSAFQNSAKIPGFRLGKVPDQIIYKRYEKDINKELKTCLIRKAYQSILKNSNLKICALINIQDKICDTNNTASFQFIIDTFPKFEIVSYKNIQINRKKVEVKDQDINAEIEKILIMHAKYKIVDRPAQKKDYAKISYQGKINNISIHELVKERPIFGTQKNTWEEVGSNTSTPLKVLTDGLIGMKAGDKKKFTQIFDKDFKFKILASKSVVYHVEIHEVRKRILPILDKAFLKRIEIDSIESLRNKIQLKLEYLYKNKEHQDCGIQVIQKLLSLHNFKLPISLIEKEKAIILKKIIAQNKNYKNIKENDQKSNDNFLIEKALQIAKKNVKLKLILMSIVDKEKIDVDQKDINKYFEQRSIIERISIQDLLKKLKKQINYMDVIKEEILFRKTIDFLIEKAITVIV